MLAPMLLQNKKLYNFNVLFYVCHGFVGGSHTCIFYDITVH